LDVGENCPGDVDRKLCAADRKSGLASSSRRDFSDKVETRSGSVKPRARIETSDVSVHTQGAACATPSRTTSPPTALPTATCSVTVPWAPPFTAVRAPSVSTSTSTRSGRGGPAAPGVWRDPGDVAPLRAAVAAGDHRRADELARALQSDRWVQAFQPLGWIEWEHDRAQSGKNSAAYRRSLDMSAAVAVTDAGTGVRLETFVSAVDDCSSPAPTARRPPRRFCAARTPCARRRPHNPVSRG